MKKSTFWILICALGIVLCTAALAVIHYATEDYEELEYTLSSDGEYYIVSDIGTCTGGNISIPAEYNGLPVTEIAVCAFRYCDGLESVTIPYSVTLIGKCAFEGCPSLTEIIVDSGNTNYKSLDGNLYNYDCTTLIQYATGKTAETFTVPEGVIKIDVYAFERCVSLKNVELCNSLTTIENYAFSECTSLESFTIPDGVISLGGSVFRGCINLSYITVGSGNVNYKSTDGVLYSYDGTSLICYPAAKTDTSFVVSDGVTNIETLAFCECSYLESITLADSVTEIGEYCFEYCLRLKTIDLGGGLSYIGFAAFNDCTALESIVIPESVTYIGYWAFLSCYSLTSVTFENTVGWYVSNSGYSTEVSTFDVSSEGLSDVSTAALYLTDTYSRYVWYLH